MNELNIEMWIVNFDVKCVDFFLFFVNLID